MSGAASKSNLSRRSGSGQLLRATAAQNIVSKNGATGNTGFTQKTGVTTDGQNKKNTAVISYDELERIRQQCLTGSISQYEQEQRNKDRQDLQQLSKARVQNWPNTIDALRKKKDEERIRRLE